MPEYARFILTETDANALSKWLIAHESDIRNEANDYGELIGVFLSVIGHMPHK